MLRFWRISWIYHPIVLDTHAKSFGFYVLLVVEAVGLTYDLLVSSVRCIVCCRIAFMSSSTSFYIPLLPFGTAVNKTYCPIRNTTSQPPHPRAVDKNGRSGLRQ